MARDRRDAASQGRSRSRRRGCVGRRAGSFLPAPLVAVVGAIAVAALGSGCATAPTGGSPRPLTGQGVAPQEFVQPLPPPGPTRDWSPGEVVEGFLHASASFALDPAAARKYLAPGVKWIQGSVTVVSKAPVTQTIPKRLNGGVGFDVVHVTGQQVASLSLSGQYTQAAATRPYTFTLQQYNGVWKIKSLPQNPDSAGSPLLLYETDFKQVFQQRNVYFFASPQNKTLVPDPVYVPLQANNSALSTNLATDLVNGLIAGPGSWANGALSSAFPIGAALKRVTINNLVATVNLGGPAEYTRKAEQAMYVQLRQTLSPPVAYRVRLEIHGKPVDFAGQTASVPQVGTANSPLYYASAASVYEVRPGASPAIVAGPAQLGGPQQITAVAVSRASRPQLAVAVRYASGCEILTGTPGASDGFKPDRIASRGGPCTSLSWDDSNRLWAVAGSRIWAIEPGRGNVQVGLPTLGTGQPVLGVMALRMAPDGVRTALLIRTKSGSSVVDELVLAAAQFSNGSVSLGPAAPVGTSLPSPGPVAVSWYSPDELAVIDGGELYEVPLTGGTSDPLGPTPAADAISLSTVGYWLTVGTAGGEIWRAQGPDSTWQSPRSGVAPAYPG